MSRMMQPGCSKFSFAKNDVDVINRARLYRAVIFGYAQNELWGLFKLAIVFFMCFMYYVEERR